MMMSLCGRRQKNNPPLWSNLSLGVIYPTSFLKRILSSPTVWPLTSIRVIFIRCIERWLRTLERSGSATASGDIYSEAGYNANLNTSGYKPAYSDLVSKLGDINSKLTLVDDTVIFKAGQTTESEGLGRKG